MHWATTLFPFIPPHVIVLAFALVLIWFLFRWGDALFVGYALWVFWQGHRDQAICYFLIAMWIGWVKAGGNTSRETRCRCLLCFVGDPLLFGFACGCGVRQPFADGFAEDDDRLVPVECAVWT